MTQPFFARSSSGLTNASGVGGETRRPALQIRDNDGILRDLSGRTFIFRIFTRDGETVFPTTAFPGVVTVSGVRATARLSGSLTALLAGRGDLQFEFAELVDGGIAIWVRGRITFERGAALITGNGPVGEDVATVDERGVITISAMGVSGKDIWATYNQTRDQYEAEKITAPVNAAVGRADTAAASALAAATYLQGQIDLGDVSGIVVLNLALASSFRARVTGAITLAIVNAVPGRKFSFVTTQTATFTVTPGVDFLPPVGPFQLTRTAGAIDTIYGEVQVAGVQVTIVNAISPFGDAATKATGVSVADPGTGGLEQVYPVRTATGAAKAFGTLDLFAETRRTNGTAAMADTLPALATIGLGEGAWLTITNAGTGSYVLSAPAGATVNGAASIAIDAGRSVQFVRNAQAGGYLSRGNGLTAALVGEEATIDATLGFTNANVGVVATGIKLLTYERSGRKISVHLSVSLTSFAWTTASGNFCISGLPFVQRADFEATFAVSRFLSQLSATPTYNVYPSAGTYMSGVVPAGDSRIFLYSNKSAAARIAVAPGHLTSGQPFSFELEGVVRT